MFTTHHPDPSGSSATPDLSPAPKIVCDTHAGFGLGFEYYGEFDELIKLRTFGSGEQYVLAAFDLLEGQVELNIGSGPELNRFFSND